MVIAATCFGSDNTMCIKTLTAKSMVCIYKSIFFKFKYVKKNIV